MALGTDVGLERIGRQALKILADNLNDELGLVEADWDDEGVPFVLERVPDASFHYGHKPSLYTQPPEAYPNIAVMAFQASPDLLSDLPLDHGDLATVSLFVDVLVKSIVSEDEVNARAARTVEAVFRVLTTHRTLDGLVNEITRMPETDLGEVEIRSMEKGYGDYWFWQGAQVRFSVQKYVSFS
jgi:hypothetical protein